MTDFRRTNIRALELFGRARDLLGSDYWLFLGITVVGVLLGSLVPFGILIGPFTVGIHMGFRAKERGETVQFGVLFKGFERFIESLVATLIVIFGSLVILSPVLAVYLLAAIGAAEASDDAVQVLAVVAALACFAAMLFVALLATALTLFIYPLIADRGVSGVDAVKLSIRAAWANKGGALRVALLNIGLGFLGTLLCFVGAFFVLPLTYGITWAAYREVFGTDEA